jgi:hypothetical protein
MQDAEEAVFLEKGGCMQCVSLLLSRKHNRKMSNAQPIPLTRNSENIFNLPS